MTTRREQLEKSIEQAASPRPDAEKIYQTRQPDIPRKRDRGYRFSNDGLIIQRPLTRDEFREGLLPEIEAMQSRYQLIVGDAANHGLDNGLIDSYEDMALLTGYTAGSIEVYASICRNIPQLTRVNSLKFKHYQVIARLDEDERPHWIHFAATYGLGYRVIESMIAEIDARLPGLPAVADEPPLPDAPALSDEKEPLIVVLNSPLKAKENRQRFNYLWKKVEHDEPLNQEDLGELYLHRAWVDMLIEREKHKK